MELVRDVLDKQIHDEEDRKVGKVDGIVIALRKGRAPRLIALELGVSTIARRLHPWLGGWVERIEQRLGVDQSDPVRIRFEHVVKTGIDVAVNIDAKRTGAHVWEDWLKEHVVGHIPGAKR
jgi:sporulation protein YlmC with PRC-barrel domain